MLSELLHVVDDWRRYTVDTDRHTAPYGRQPARCPGAPGQPARCPGAPGRPARCPGAPGHPAR